MRNEIKATDTRAKSTRTLTLKRLPSAQLRRLPRPHIGYEGFVELFAKIVAQHGDEIGVGIDVDAMRTSVRNAQELAPARQVAADAVSRALEQLALVEDTQAVETSNAWVQMLLIYGRARQAARTNPQIEVALEPFTRFMKRGPYPKKTRATMG